MTKIKAKNRKRAAAVAGAAICSATLQRRALKSITKNITRNTHAIAKELKVNHCRASSIPYSMRRKGAIVRVSKGLSGSRGYPPLWMLPRAKADTYYPGLQRASDEHKQKLIREIVCAKSPNDQAHAPATKNL